MTDAATTVPPPAFLAAYDALLATWPAGFTAEPSTIPTPFGPTRLNSCGPADAPPLLLLPGGGATSGSWYANVADLARTHRVHAIDPVGESGMSVPDPDRPLRTLDDQRIWLDALLDAVGARPDRPAVLAGHSYGAWTALQYALRAPDRLSHLILLDPTQCFAGLSKGYLARALPMLLRPRADRITTFLTWETQGVPLDPAWLQLQLANAEFKGKPPVTAPSPVPAELRTLRPRTLVVMAGRSRSHDSAKVAARAAALLPAPRIAVLPQATHHSMPFAQPAELALHVREFLGTP
ncbi:alpha/beta fold hydrolase [Streptomyces sp. NPDC051561]|uniref:alpha/beta fold hydrolase n=1 Tax=Streptomyces sp. NPDC051561 TaxID=3365658 RepID=UPI003791D823